MSSSPIWRVVKPAITAALPLLSGAAIRATGRPFSGHEMRPHASGHRYGWTHYGVMIPDLPEPHRYFSIMVIAGQTGIAAFDVEEAVKTSPRDTVSVSVSTAAEGAQFYRSYSMREQCELRSDGSRLDFGGDVIVHGTYPDMQISVRAGGFEAEIRLRGTDQVAWFTRSPLYDHLSLCVEYDGWISLGGNRTEISSLGTFEYAACAGIHGLFDRPVSAAVKVPVDFFSYHVIGLSPRSQVLLADVGGFGDLRVTMAYHRGVGEPTWVTHDNVRFDVTEYAVDAVTEPNGHRMRLPAQFTWTAGTDLVVSGTVDSPPRFGVGRGYIMGYHCHGHFRGRAFDSRAYMEYVDVRGA